MIPVYAQEQPASCVAACVRMVLAALDLHLAEQEIRTRCGQTAVGLRLIDVAKGLSDLPVAVHVHTDWGMDDLRDEIRHSHYPIVGIDLRPIDGRFAYHAVVVVKIESDKVPVHDPEAGQGIRELNTTSFMDAWDGADRQVLMVTKKADS
ncbi:MAG: cysteine peptidase family C39 domain-containing protein [candidate division KSB1 bacterium]|nr:cysteine peptidase family C39 domain-containing protein [candidate division KSB1 bacterium]MDZ7304286.1 cysteine peptidase family C39 domain-containing protein [candidate division KSB1 bacterium]MDZ7312915.1 cysteine peptidase family C39 domain-containing protein [candidate division KSB1 bacterium]